MYIMSAGPGGYRTRMAPREATKYTDITFKLVINLVCWLEGLAAAGRSVQYTEISYSTPGGPDRGGGWIVS